MAAHGRMRAIFLLVATGMIATAEAFTAPYSTMHRLASIRETICPARRGCALVVMQSQGGGGGRDKNSKWSADVQDEDAERIESGKVAVASAIVGSIVAAPLALLIPGEFSA